jgi:hypothetical protein
VPAVLVPSVVSEAVTVAEPAVLSVTLIDWVPELSAVPLGNKALGSVAVIATRSLAVETRFQFASTALTVRLKAVPAVRPPGTPVLPPVVPGAALSPGARICSLLNTPAPTAREGEV